MTPKEKAQDMFNDVINHLNSDAEWAKQSCLFIVWGIIDNYDQSIGKENTIDYWKEVKQELDNL